MATNMANQFSGNMGAQGGRKKKTMPKAKKVMAVGKAMKDMKGAKSAKSKKDEMEDRKFGMR